MACLGAATYDAQASCPEADIGPIHWAPDSELLSRSDHESERPGPRTLVIAPMRVPCEPAEDRHTTGSEVTVMARQLVIEEESGTCSRGTHVHNGYFAGDFGVGSSDLIASPPTCTSGRVARSTKRLVATTGAAGQAAVDRRTCLAG